MQELMALPIAHDSADDSDQEALELFNNLGAQLSPSQHRSESHAQQNQEEEEQAPRLSRLFKQKKESKRDRKKRKISEKKMEKKLKHRKALESPAPRKKIKREISTKKKSEDNDDQKLSKGEGGSSQQDSMSQHQSDMNQELNNLNPEFGEEAESPRKKLKKASGRKQRIQDREGFKLDELGNEDFKYSDDESYSGDKRKKKKGKKASVKVLTNQEIMNSIKDHGVVQSEGEELGDRDYDRGLDMMNLIKGKANKNTIRVNNRMFGDLQAGMMKNAEQVEIPDNLELQLGPKNSTGTQRKSFLSRAENIKKQRGLEAEVNMEDYEKKAEEKAKKSISRIVNSMMCQDYHDDLDLEVNIPTVSRGKSSDLLNNTNFLRQYVGKKDSLDSEEVKTVPLKQTKSFTYGVNQKKQVQTRQKLFKEMQQQTRLRRSKYISNEQLKNSFKKTNLYELEEARKKILEKKRRDVQEDEQQSEEQKVDSEMMEMIEREQRVCGDLSADSQKEEQEEQKQQEDKEQQDKQKEDKEQKLGENVEEQVDGLKSVDDEEGDGEVNQELQEYRQLIDDIASESENKENQEQQSGQNELIDDDQVEQKKELLKVKSQVDQEPAEEIESNSENEKEIKELQDQGIIVRRRRKQQEIDLKDLDMNDYLIEAPKDEIQADQDLRLPEEMVAENKITKDEIIYDDDNEEFFNFKKLRKIALVNAKKKKEKEIGRQYASQFIQNQAEQGSDNQQHDDLIKNINYEAEDKEYDGMDLDADLVQLIDNAVDINEEDQFEAFRKYLEEGRAKDREEIKKIMRGQFWKKHENLELEVEEDERKRQERMEEVINWMKKREDEEVQGIYAKESEESEHDSDEDSEYLREKKKKKQQQQQIQSESDHMPEEEQRAKLQKFMEDFLPSTKSRTDSRPAISDLNNFMVPESVKRQKSSAQNTISMTKIGGRMNINPLSLLTRRSTSSLVNESLNRGTKAPKKKQSHVFPIQKSKK